MAVLGPTNTGKTHLAVERMLGHASGMIGLPLRLLAREIYDRIVKLRGLRSVHQHLGEQYARLRIGIGHPGDKDQVLDYVLGRPIQPDLRLIEDALSRAQSALETLLGQSWDKASQQLHTDPNAVKPAKKPPPEPKS